MKKIGFIWDLDGTLFNSKSQIPKSAINAIEKYSKQGVHFAFCTGRGFMEMDEVIDRLAYMEYAITANGAYIFNAWSKKDISKSLINPIDILNIYNILKIFENRDDVQYVARLVLNKEIEENNYNLSVSTYVEKEDTREVIDIKELNKQLDEIVKRENILRDEISKIIAEIEADHE